MQPFVSVLISKMWWVLLMCPHLSAPMNTKAAPEIKEYPEFGRECKQNLGAECTFAPNREGNGTLYFSCKPGKQSSFCFCGTGSPPLDELMFPLEWDSALERCFVGKGGPCGSDRGLNVSCRSKDNAGIECIQGRCRHPEQLHTVDVSKFCNDNLDCKNGLECRESITPVVVKVKKCYQSQK